MKAGKAEWYHRFFRGLWLEFQKSMDSPELVGPTVDFLEEILELPAGARILDAPCGEGRVSRELARRGYAVTGVDLSEALLREARRRGKREGIDIDYRQGDLRALRWRGRFDAVLCMWGSFGYFDEAGNLRQAKAARRALRPGGCFFMDGHSPETLFPRFARRHWFTREGIRVLSANRYDLERGRIETDWTLIKGEREQRTSSSLRLYTVKELIDLFDAAGFVHYRWWGSYEGDPFELDSSRLLFLAETPQR
jgi:SAM-dependent methyltransferase